MQLNILFPKTSWIKNLLLTALFESITIVFSLILLVLNFAYSVGQNFSIFDSVSFPIQIILNTYVFFVSFYFFANCFGWIYVSKQASGLRRILNFSFSILFLIFSLIIFADSIYRYILIFKAIGPFLSATTQTLLKPVFIGWFLEGSNSFGFNVIIVFSLSLLSFILCISFYYFQLLKYKSENEENKKEKTINGYIDNFVKIKKKKMKKSKPNDLSKKITSF